MIGSKHNFRNIIQTEKKSSIFCETLLLLLSNFKRGVVVMCCIAYQAVRRLLLLWRYASLDSPPPQFFWIEKALSFGSLPVWQPPPHPTLLKFVPARVYQPDSLFFWWNTCHKYEANADIDLTKPETKKFCFLKIFIFYHIYFFQFNCSQDLKKNCR